MSTKRKRLSAQCKQSQGRPAERGDHRSADQPLRWGYPMMLSAWKRSAAGGLDGSVELFDKDRKSHKQMDGRIDEPYRCSASRLIISIRCGQPIAPTWEYRG
jgi:hypothetical protein